MASGSDYNHGNLPSDFGSGGGGGGSISYIPGTASLVAEIDKRLLIVLRDGRTLIGYLRSIDQFANLVTQSTIERIHVGKEYGDIPRGVFVIRGENVVLLGEIDPEKEANLPLKRVSVDEILERQRAEQILKEKREKVMENAFKERGMEPHVNQILIDEQFF